MSFAKLRRSKNFRLIVIVVLLIIVGFLWFTWEKFRLLLAGIFLTLLLALGLEVSGSDWDIGKLIETGSLDESKVHQTEKGTWLVGDECNENNLNCDNFKYQEEAQDLFESCGGMENDVHKLDGDGNGIVCEALPSRANAS